MKRAKVRVPLSFPLDEVEKKHQSPFNLVILPLPHHLIQRSPR